MLGILNKTLWSVPILQRCPKLSHVLAQKILPVLLSARFASASLKPISITFPGWGPSTPTWQEPDVVSNHLIQQQSFLGVRHGRSTCIGRVFKTCRHQRRRVAKTMLKLSKFASFRSTKMLHLTSQLCLL